MIRGLRLWIRTAEVRWHYSRSIRHLQRSARDAAVTAP